MKITEEGRLPTIWLQIIAVLGWVAVIYLAYFVAAYDAVMRSWFSIGALTDSLPAALAEHPFQARYVEHPWWTLLHTVPGFFFMVLGPLQFMSPIRNRWINLHRFSGKVYLGATTLVALGAMAVGFAFPMWGWTFNQWAAFIFGLMLLFFVFKAYSHIRSYRVSQHREWMIRGFAFGLSIATFRVLLDDVLQPMGMEFTTAWNIVTYISFAINISAAELWIRATRPVTKPSGSFRAATVMERA